MFLVRLLVLVCVALAFATPVSENGALHFDEDGYVVNEKGNKYQLRGMSFFWNIEYWGQHGFWNSSVVSSLAKDWKANVIRAAIGDKSLTDAKNMIDWAIANGIYVIVDNHSHCAHNELSASQNFFSEISAYAKQKGAKNVIYELYNEPLYANCSGSTDTQSGGAMTSWAQIKTYAEAVIPKIRANDKNGMILVGTPKYSQGVGYAADNPITMDNNVGYVLHFYASEEGHSGLRNTLIRSRCQKLPVFITEWGTSGASGDGQLKWDLINPWVALIEQLGYSWANWSISNKGESSSAIRSGGGTNGGWSNDQLSESGKFLKKIISGLNSGGTLSSVGISEITIKDCKAFEASQSVWEFVRTGMGKFDVRIDGEDYLDSNGIKTVTDKEANSYNKLYIQTTTSSKAWAEYQMDEVPADGYYALAINYMAPNKDIELKYTVNGFEQSVTLPKTSSTTKFGFSYSAVQLAEGTSLFKFDFDGISTDDLKFDAFWAAPLDSADSVDFGITKDMQVEVPSTDGIADAGFASKVYMILVDRTLHFDGILKGGYVEIMDLQGRVMKRQHVMPGATVNISDLKRGSYIVRLKDSSTPMIQKIMLQ